MEQKLIKKLARELNISQEKARELVRIIALPDCKVYDFNTRTLATGEHSIELCYEDGCFDADQHIVERLI